MDIRELKIKLDSIKDKLTKIEEKSDKRIYLVCENENSFDVNKFLYEDMGCRFVIATCYHAENWFEILYHFAYDSLGCIITNKTIIRDMENPTVKSFAPVLPAAEWIEREMADLMGFKFEGHPDPRRLILADDWPEGVYPLRREVKK